MGLSFLVSILAASLTYAATSTKRPNVLLIISDDLRPELGCYGVEGVKTPEHRREATVRLFLRLSFDSAQDLEPVETAAEPRCAICGSSS